MILAVVWMSGVAIGYVTHCLFTDILAVELSTSRAKLTMSILVKLADIDIHVNKLEWFQDCLEEEKLSQRGLLDVPESEFYHCRQE